METAGSVDDQAIASAHAVRLRSERAGTGDGRVYTITITARDAANNTSTATTDVTVPHNRCSSSTSDAREGDERNIVREAASTSGKLSGGYSRRYSMTGQRAGPCRGNSK